MWKRQKGRGPVVHPHRHIRVMDVNEIFHVPFSIFLTPLPAGLIYFAQIPAVPAEEARRDVGKKRKLAGPTQADLDRVKEKMNKTSHPTKTDFAMPLPKSKRDAPMPHWEREEAKLNPEQRELLAMLDASPSAGPSAASGTTEAVRRMVSAVVKALQVNTTQRLKYAEQPESFMESETDLSIVIRDLFGLPGAPESLKTLVTANGVPDLLQLLGHENNEIALSFLDVLREWTDEDVEREMEGETQSARDALKLFVDTLVHIVF